MPEFLEDVVCWIGVSFLIYRIYNLVVSTAKIFTGRGKSGSENILHEQR